MLRRFKRAFEILFNEGLISLLKKTRKFTSTKTNQTRQDISDAANWYFGKIRGYVNISINGTSANFICENKYSIYRTLDRLRLEKDIIQDFLGEIEGSDVVYDIGANTGLYTCLAGQKSTQVIAFEPYPPNVNELKNNVDINQGSYQVIEKGLSNKTRTMEFAVPESTLPGYGSPAIDTGTGHTLELPVVRGDELIRERNIPKPDIIKIDVEGAEYLVIEGLEEVLSNKGCRVIYCEVHLEDEGRPSINDFGVDSTELYSLIEKKGFSITCIDKGENSYHLKATR